MSERMKQHDLDEQRAALARSAERWRYAGRIVAEAERARASEDEKMLENARLLNEREAMEGQIKALADALVNLRCIAVSQGVSEQHGVIVNADAALRLAGRL